MRWELSDQYIRRASATILALTKIIGGVAAGYVLFGLIRLLIQVFGMATELSVSLNNLMRMIVEEYQVSDPFLRSFATMMQESSLPLAITGSILIIILIGLFLVVLEMIALLTLRFAKKGAGLVRGIHIIYMISYCIHLPLFVCLVINYLINRSDFLKAAGELKSAALGVDVIMLIVAGVYLIILLLGLCYHKDIAGAMRTVSFDLRSRSGGKLIRTHLSGISFIMGLPFVACFIFLVIGMVNNNVPTAESTGNSAGNNWVMLAILFILILKQYSVCFCYRNLKKAHEELEMNIPSRIR